MIKQEIERLVAVLQAMTLQRMNAIREGKLSEAEQIRSVQEDIDNKIQELTCLAQVETAIRK
jgi:Na+/phosphate symporter